MPISDRDRKILWGRAGSRCSMCRAELVQEQPSGALALVGEECHIVSPRAGGPRGVHSPGPHPELDAYSNLILLCAVDHRRVDQLPSEFPVDALQAIKVAHELWQRSRTSGPKSTRVVVKRASSPYLHELVTSRDLLGLMVGADESSLDHEDVDDDEEAGLVGGFLQQVYDWSEMWDDLEPASRVKATLAVREELEALRRGGWRVFGATATGRLEGGVGGSSSPWTTAFLHVARADSPAIVQAFGDPDPRESAEGES